MVCPLNGLENALARARDALGTASLEIRAILIQAESGKEIEIQSRTITSIGMLRDYQDGLMTVTEAVADMQTVLSLGS